MGWKATLWCFTITCACLNIRGYRATFAVSPKNVAVRKGDRLVLNCSSHENELYWSKSNCLHCTRKKISFDPDLPSYQVSRSDKEIVELIIPSVSMVMAGSYVCGNDDFGVSSLVVVLDADPECWISSIDVKESEIVEMSCAVIYKGNWTPNMKWKTSDGQELAGTEHFLSDNSGNRLVYSASIQITHALNGMQFQCITHFDQPKSSSFMSQDIDCNCDLCTDKLPFSVCATSVPEYSFVWSSPPISVSGNQAPFQPQSSDLHRRKRAASDNPQWLSDYNFCSAEQGHTLSCPSNAPTSLQLHSGQTMFGRCQSSDIPSKYAIWKFCPSTCDSSSSNQCYSISSNNSNPLAYFTKTKISSDASGLYFCQLDNLTATTVVYSVCVSVAKSDCVGTSVRWWRWYQAAVAIVTVDIIAAICFLVMVIVILLDNDSTITFCSRLLLIVLNHLILLILAAMMIIGCAICLSRDTVSSAVKWETGVLVMFALLFFFGLLSAIVTGIYRCKGMVHLYVVIFWDIVTILVALATLIWTLINMSRCRTVQKSKNSGEWSWEIFLLALAIAVLVFGLMVFLWYIRRKKHCKCCRGTNRWNCHISVCGCCKHHEREQIKVGSASSRDTIDHSNYGSDNFRQSRYVNEGCCCFCACCKRKIGNDPELVSEEIHQQRHVKTERTHRTVTIVKESPDYRPHRQHYSWVCCHCKKRDFNGHLSDSLEHEEHIQRTRSRQHYSWVCCAPMCHRKKRADRGHISRLENADEEREERIKEHEIVRRHRNKTEVEIDANEYHRQHYTWRSCLCCGKINEDFLDERMNRRNINEHDLKINGPHVRPHYAWVCCGSCCKRKRRDDREQISKTQHHKDDDDDNDDVRHSSEHHVKQQVTKVAKDSGGGCLACCYSSSQGENKPKVDQNKKKQVGSNSAGDKNKEKEKDKQKSEKQKSPTRTNRKDDDSDEEKEKKQKHEAHKVERIIHKEKEKDDDSPQSRRKSVVKVTRANSPKLTSRRKEEDSDTDTEKRHKHEKHKGDKEKEKDDDSPLSKRKSDAKKARPNSPKSSRKEDDSDAESDTKLKKQKQDRYKSERTSDKEKDEEDSPNSKRKSHAKNANNRNKDDNSDSEPEEKSTDRNAEKKPNKDNKNSRNKLPKDFTLPPLLDSIELQENSSQGRVKRFVPPRRVLATSVLSDDDRSLTPDIPGRGGKFDSSPETSPRRSKKTKY